MYQFWHSVFVFCFSRLTRARELLSDATTLISTDTRKRIFELRAHALSEWERVYPKLKITRNGDVTVARAGTSNANGMLSSLVEYPLIIIMDTERGIPAQHVCAIKSLQHRRFPSATNVAVIRCTQNTNVRMSDGNGLLT